MDWAQSLVAFIDAGVNSPLPFLTVLVASPGGVSLIERFRKCLCGKRLVLQFCPSSSVVAHNAKVQKDSLWVASFAFCSRVPVPNNL